MNIIHPPYFVSIQSSNSSSNLTSDEQLNEQSSNSSSNLPSIDQLREELLCAICLDICYMPSTTPCGHSFCRKCLRSAIKSCGRKCPKCMQSIREGRSLTVNTVLWNTIQLIFPKEIEARKVVLDTVNNQQATPRQTSSRSTRARNIGTRIPWR